MNFFHKKRILSAISCMACIISLVFSSTVSNAYTKPIVETEKSEQAITEMLTNVEIDLPTFVPIATDLPTVTKPETFLLAEEETLVKQIEQKIKPKVIRSGFATGYIRVRKKCSKESSEVTLLKPGQKVRISKIKGNWIKVQAGKKTGFVCESFLKTSKKEAVRKAKEKADSFRITGYCPCGSCSEGYGRSTRSGRKATAGRTVAADLNVLSMYTEVYIDGLGRYTVEDVGGGVKGAHIDVFVNEHCQCSGVTTNATDVFVVEG